MVDFFIFYDISEWLHFFRGWLATYGAMELFIPITHTLIIYNIFVEVAFYIICQHSKYPHLIALCKPGRLKKSCYGYLSYPFIVSLEDTPFLQPTHEICGKVLQEGD